MARKLTKDDVDKYFEYGFDIKNRVIDASSISSSEEGESGVDYALYKQISKGLEILKSESNVDPIRIILNNPGGDDYHCWGIINSIQNLKDIHVTIEVKGQASSAGSMILQAADHRIMTKDSTLMIHYGEWSYSGHSIDFIRSAEECKRQIIKMEDLFLEKIKVVKPKYKRNHFRTKFAFDVFMSPEEAVKWNLVDEIL